MVFIGTFFLSTPLTVRTCRLEVIVPAPNFPDLADLIGGSGSIAAVPVPLQNLVVSLLGASGTRSDMGSVSDRISWPPATLTAPGLGRLAPGLQAAVEHRDTVMAQPAQ